MILSTASRWRNVTALLIATRWLALTLVAVLLTGAALAQTLTFPTLTGRVVDEAGLLGATDRASLSASIAAFEAKTGDQLVVVTLASLRGVSIEDYGYQLGRHWGIGRKDSNSGVLLIVAPNERATRIEVGYGLEGTLTDAASKLIIEAVILPRFRAGDYPDGIKRGVEQIIQILSSDAPAKPNLATPLGDVPTLPVIVVALIFVAFVIYCLVSGGAFCRFMFQLLFMMMLTGGRRSSGSGSSYSGGGGSFGGGGSSGRW